MTSECDVGPRAAWRRHAFDRREHVATEEKRQTDYDAVRVAVRRGEIVERSRARVSAEECLGVADVHRNHRGDAVLGADGEGQVERWRRTQETGHYAARRTRLVVDR